MIPANMKIVKTGSCNFSFSSLLNIRFYFKRIWIGGSSIRSISKYNEVSDTNIKKQDTKGKCTT